MATARASAAVTSTVSPRSAGSQNRMQRDAKGSASTARRGRRSPESQTASTRARPSHPRTHRPRRGSCRGAFLRELAVEEARAQRKAPFLAGFARWEAARPARKPRETTPDRRERSGARLSPPRRPRPRPRAHDVRRRDDRRQGLSAAASRNTCITSLPQILPGAARRSASRRPAERDRSRSRTRGPKPETYAPARAHPSPSPQRSARANVERDGLNARSTPH